MNRQTAAMPLACASLVLFACQPIAPVVVASTGSQGTTPLATETPVPALGRPLAFHYLGSASVRLSDGEGQGTVNTARIRSEAAWRQAIGTAEGLEQDVDFASHEVLAVVDPLHACVGWPDQQGVRYERGFWLVDVGDRVRFSVHVTAAGYGVLCRPAMALAFYRLPRLDKAIEDDRGEAVPTWPGEAAGE